MTAEARLAPELHEAAPPYEAPAPRVQIRGRIPAPLPSGSTDDLRASRGILLSALIGAALWIAILSCAWFIAR